MKELKIHTVKDINMIKIIFFILMIILITLFCKIMGIDISVNINTFLLLLILFYVMN